MIAAINVAAMDLWQCLLPLVAFGIAGVGIRNEPLVFYERLIDFAISQRSPFSSKMTNREKTLLSEIAWSNCQLALALSARKYPDHKAIDTIFISGALLFDVLGPSEGLAKWISLAEDRTVTSNPKWLFKILIGLVNSPTHRLNAAKKIIELQLSREDLPLRDELIKGILSSEIRLKSVERKQLAMHLMAINWESSSLTTKKDILEKAVRFNSAPS